MSRINGYDKWLNSYYDEGPDPNEEQEHAHFSALEDMEPGEQFDPFSEDNWLEAVSQLELPEEIEDMSQATDEQKEKVKEYWYNKAYNQYLD